ncbi:MAG: hypothetical protein ABIN89_13285 [Chitinophagaceae bacterium]
MTNLFQYKSIEFLFRDCLLILKTLHFQKLVVVFIIITATCNNPVYAQQSGNTPSKVIDIGSRRELFVDDYLVEKLSGKAGFCLHHPELRDVAIIHDKPWEGNTSGYHSIFKDGNLFRMYYRGSQITLTKEKFIDAHPFYICYAESIDGLHWRKPNLGLFDFEGSKKNNIILASGKIGGLQLNMGDNASMFKDENPDASPDARYKAMVCSSKPKGLYVFKSSDAIHWLPMNKEPVITEGAFDSQNIAFYDSVKNEYRCYWRYFKEVANANTVNKIGIRAVRTAVSKDFLHWTEINDVAYNDSLPIELYTNQVKTYYRAPQIFIGLPTRYIERGWSPSMRALPDGEHRELRSSHNLRYGTALTDAMLMTSRDGIQFTRWSESFLRPGIERDGTWNYGQQYIGWGMIETKSNLKGAPYELSFYSTESSWTSNAPTSDLRRYTLRLDGFVSVQSPMSGGELLTKPLRFQGKKLSLNFATSVAGELKVEIQDENGKAFPGFSLDDCSPVFGDTIERAVTWKQDSDLNTLSGRIIRLRFVLQDADLYSFQFHN